MKQPRTLDEARVAYPYADFYLVATAGRVVLDMVTIDGVSHGWEAASEAEAWAVAFPATEAEPVDPPAWPPTEQMQREVAVAPAPLGLFD